MQIKQIVKEETELEKLLDELGFSKDYSSELLRKKKCIRINGQAYCKDFFLKPGDIVEIAIEDECSDILCSDTYPDVIYEDDCFLVVNKPKNLASIPTIAHYTDNLASRVKKYYEETRQSCGIHILNRLDYETRGVVLFAKNRFISNIARNCEIIKQYKATVIGILEEKHGIIDKPILKVGHNKKRIIDSRGKKSVTEYTVTEEKGNYSRLLFKLHTGRTHQIRVHMASIGHPLTGDSIYGDGKGEFDLTCFSIEFIFPLNEKHYVLTV
ncbi:MAG: RluA family pseudouridine synthase [Clostridiales bacterium]|nr:RluA family pseudouridine synthase [Clostridiales bacterium]